MADTTSIEDSRVLAAERGGLSRTLVSYSIIAIMLLLFGVFALMVVVIFHFHGNTAMVDRAINIADKVISSFFPLVGAWVGAVVAFYFARDNFVAATQSAQTLLGRGPVDPLAGKVVQPSMIPIEKATMRRGADAVLRGTKLGDLLDDMTKASVTRLPLLFEDGKPFAVLHAARIRQFFDEKAPGLDRTTATLQAMIDDPEYGRWLSGSYVAVAPSASLAEAWAAMQAQKVRMGRLGCMDALVTTNGKSDEKVVGYLTDEMINRERTATQ